MISGVALGGVSELGPSRAKISAALALERPCKVNDMFKMKSQNNRFLSQLATKFVHCSFLECCLCHRSAAVTCIFDFQTF